MLKSLEDVANFMEASTNNIIVIDTYAFIYPYYRRQ